MKTLLTLIMCLLLSACTASQYLGNTKASVSIANGFNYESNKNQEGLEASGELSSGALKFSVKTNATTPEAAIAAAMQANLATIQLINKLIDAAIAAGQQAATRGVPVPRVPPVPTPAPVPAPVQ